MRIFVLIFLILNFLSFPIKAAERDYIIYNISHEFPMGYANEKLKKNFYISIGANQGIKNGTVLNVIRSVSMLDPYKSKKRYDYKVPIGKIEVIHTEDTIAIGKLLSINSDEKTPLVEIPNFVIGDQIEVAID